MIGDISKGTTEMAAYVVVQVDVKDAVRYADYKAMVPPSLEKFGGRFIVRGGQVHPMEGTWSPKRFVLVEFPSVEAAKAWWASPEYAAAKALRQATAESELIIVDGV
jgi:uncharacterized protein (DUF1330 family)